MYFLWLSVVVLASPKRYRPQPFLDRCRPKKLCRLCASQVDNPNMERLPPHWLSSLGIQSKRKHTHDSKQKALYIDVDQNVHELRMLFWESCNFFFFGWEVWGGKIYEFFEAIITLNTLSYPPKYWHGSAPPFFWQCQDFGSAWSTNPLI